MIKLKNKRERVSFRTHASANFAFSIMDFTFAASIFATIDNFMPHLWQGQSEIKLKIYKKTISPRKGHFTNCLQIRQQLLSDPGFGHIHIIAQPSAICKNCKIAHLSSLTAYKKLTKLYERNRISRWQWYTFVPYHQRHQQAAHADL